jgi:hypothetical protein
MHEGNRAWKTNILRKTSTELCDKPHFEPQLAMASSILIPLHTVPKKDKPKPWKSIGYRGFSAFLASDNDFLIFRRFGALTARTLLLWQDEITILEEELEKLEALHSSPSATDIHNGSFRQEALPERTKILFDIRLKLLQYSKSS